jgi:L-fuconolactonase
MTHLELIDSHQHAWDQKLFEYPWLSNRPDLPRIALPGGDKRVGVILVEAGARSRQAEAEASWLSELAVTHLQVLGVVAAMSWQRPDTSALSRWAENAVVVGVRIELTPSSSQDAGALSAAMLLADKAGLSVDVLCGFADLPLLERALSLAPEVRTVIDHLGGPPLSSGFTSENAARWADSMRMISAYPNTRVKVSGGHAPTSPAVEVQWREHLVHAVLELFGPTRIMVGSDWPVSNSEPDGVRGRTWFDFVAATLNSAWGPAIAFETAASTYQLAITRVPAFHEPVLRHENGSPTI